MRGPHPQVVHRHFPGARDRRAGAGGGALLQNNLPLPVTRDHDQMDQGEGHLDFPFISVAWRRTVLCKALPFKPFRILLVERSFRVNSQL